MHALAKRTHTTICPSTIPPSGRDSRVTAQRLTQSNGRNHRFTTLLPICCVCTRRSSEPTHTTTACPACSSVSRKNHIQWAHHTSTAHSMHALDDQSETSWTCNTACAPTQTTTTTCTHQRTRFARTNAQHTHAPTRVKFVALQPQHTPPSAHNWDVTERPCNASTNAPPKSS